MWPDGTCYIDDEHVPHTKSIHLNSIELSHITHHISYVIHIIVPILAGPLHFTLEHISEHLTLFLAFYRWLEIISERLRIGWCSTYNKVARILSHIVSRGIGRIHLVLIIYCLAPHLHCYTNFIDFVYLWKYGCRFRKYHYQLEKTVHLQVSSSL